MGRRVIRISCAGHLRAAEIATDIIRQSEGLEIAGVRAHLVEAAMDAAATDVDAVVLVIGEEDAVPGTSEVARAREHADCPIVLVLTGERQLPPVTAAALGLDDVVVASAGPDSLEFSIRKAIATAAERRDRGYSSDRARVVTVFSAKGGVGTTTVATNLAVLSARSGTRTLLIDLDLASGDCALALGLRPGRTIFDLAMEPEALKRGCIDRYVTRHASGLDVLCAPVDPDQGSMIRLETLTTLLSDVRWGWDLMVVDTPTSLGAVATVAIDLATDMLIVTSLDVPSTRATAQIVTTLEHAGFTADRTHVVLNRSGTDVGLSEADVRSTIGHPVEWTIPSSRDVVQAMNLGRGVVDHRHDHPVVTSFTALYEGLLGRGLAARPSRRRRWIFGRSKEAAVLDI